MNYEEIAIRSKDGAAIECRTYGLDAANTRGVIIVCHGFGEHAGSYTEFAETLLRAQYASVLPNLRGHGTLSNDPATRKKLQGVIPGYHSFLDDIECVAAYVRQTAPSLPIILYGHSMGGNIAANYLLRRDQSAFACAVLESPWLGLKNEVDPFTAVAARLLGGLSPRIAIIKTLHLPDITGDTAKAEGIENDPLYHNRISLRMFTGIQNGCRYAIRYAPDLKIPALILIAKREAIVSNRAIYAFAEQCGDSVLAKEYDSCHAIHNDDKREEFYHDLAEFLDAHCGGE